jgi:hypothetical protein
VSDAGNADVEIAFAKQANGEVWALLDADTRTPDQITEMVTAAYASMYHWNRVGGPREKARAEWLIARVMTVLEDADAALWHAQRSAAICGEGDVADFDIAYGHEALARVHALTGNLDEAARERSLAYEAGAAIADAEDRKIFEDDLAGGPWFGLES